MKKKNPPPLKPTMPRHEAGEQHEPPSPAAMIERRRAQEAADRNPLAYALGEPLPGRSALDKMRARMAGGGDSEIAPDNSRGRHGGRTNSVSPGQFIDDGRARTNNRMRI